MELQEHDTFLHHMETWKKSEPQMGFKSTTRRDIVGCSNH